MRFLKRIAYAQVPLTCAEPESFVRGGTNMIISPPPFFLVCEAIKEPNTTINGSSLAR